MELATGKRRQLTSHTQDNFGARFGPDGSTIAYHSSRIGEGSEVFLYHFDGTAETRITNSPSWDVYPDWSPDGRRIAFASDRRDDGKFRLYVANSDNGGERELVDDLITGRIAYSPVNSKLVCRWSPDGRRVAYIVTKEEGSSLWSVNADGTEPRKHFRSVVAFDWYRDARHGIFTRVNGGVSDLMAIDLETGEESLLFSGPLMEIDVAPDGSAVSFCLGQGHMSMGLAVLKLE